MSLPSFRYTACRVLLPAALALQSCTSNPPAINGKTSAGTPTDAASSRAFPKLHYHFYLETSSSTDAYLTSGTTRFNTAINQLQAFLNTHEGRQSFHIHEIANVPYTVFSNATDQQVNSYFSNLSKAAVDKHAAGKANRTSSDLSNIIATVLEKTGPQDLSVLVSDCVVDTKNNGSNLASQQSNLQTLVRRRLDKSPFSALILRDTSELRGGLYYPPAGGSEKLNGYRPYFMILVGPPVAIQALATELSARNSFFAQSVLLGPKASVPASSLLPPPGGLDYYASDPESARNLIAKKPKLSGPGKDFVLQVQADLSGVPATEAYKLDAANYEVTPASYRLDIKARPQGQYTHVLVLTSPTLGPDHAVQVRLKNTLPDWVAQYSSEYTGLLRNKPEEMPKTYGLAYLLRGFAEGFNPSPYMAELKPVAVKR